MYSVVLMLALGGSAETPQWCRGCFGCCGCFGCNGCCGGFVCNGCYGCCGHGRWNCNGCWGCHGTPVACNGCSGYMIVPSGQTPEQIQQPKRKQETTSAPATLIINLPRDATLTIDDRPTEAKSQTRVFVTPALPRNGEFTYALKAQITRDGQSVVTTRQVAVRGGQRTFVQLVFPTMEVMVTDMDGPE